MEIVKEFGINPILLIAQIVNFAILLFILQKLLYKPILKVLDERKKKIAKSLKEAEEIEKRLEKTNIEQEQILDRAKSEAAGLIKEAKEEAKALAEKTISEAKAQVDQMLQKNKSRLDLEKEQMMKEVKRDLADIVMVATAKVSQETLTKETNKQMVEKVVKEVRD